MPAVGQLEYLIAIKPELIKHIEETENKITSVVLASIQMAWRPSPGHVLCLFAQVSCKMGYLSPFNVFYFKFWHREGLGFSLKRSSKMSIIIISLPLTIFPCKTIHSPHKPQCWKRLEGCFYFHHEWATVHQHWPYTRLLGSLSLCNCLSFFSWLNCCI